MLQAVGAATNGTLNKSLVNPWLATSVSVLLVLFLSIALFACMPRPLPTIGDVQGMPWWAPIGGITGAVALFGIAQHAMNPWRALGAVLMIAGVTLIAKF